MIDIAMQAQISHATLPACTRDRARQTCSLRVCITERDTSVQLCPRARLLSHEQQPVEVEMQKDLIKAHGQRYGHKAHRYDPGHELHLWVSARAYMHSRMGMCEHSNSYISKQVHVHMHTSMRTSTRTRSHFDARMRTQACGRTH